MAAAQRLLADIRGHSRVEIIVVDADDPQWELGAPGRARQMNAGAARARGDWLLFLHADSRLPHGWLTTFDLHTRGVEGGWFRFALDDTAWQARAIERGVRWRVRLFRLPYGDQGIFVRRSTFVAMGGYREIALMEDVDFVRRLVARAAVVELPIALATSSRRWRRDGWWRRSVRNVVLLALYFAGVSPSRLARWYG